VRTKAARKRLAERFKAPDDDLRLVIVCDMWLTGFDCPPAHTMYLDKPLAGHNLMQAIARVNRVYGDKPGGSDRRPAGAGRPARRRTRDLHPGRGHRGGGQAGPGRGGARHAGAFEKLRAFFHGCDYERALDAAPGNVLAVYLRAIDHILGQNDGWKRFRALVKELSTAFALAVPRPETEAITPHLAFFQRAAAMIRKRLADERGGGGDRGRQRDIDAAVRQVIGGAVDADDVIDLFAVAGLDECASTS
jgi:type I restriction enzyme R subunit